MTDQSKTTTDGLPDVIYAIGGPEFSHGNHFGDWEDDKNSFPDNIKGTKYIRADLVPAAPVISREDAKRAKGWFEEVLAFIKDRNGNMLVGCHHYRQKETIRALLTAAAKESE